MRSLAHGAEPQLLEQSQSAADAALYRLLNGSRSGPAYVEEGSTILSVGVTDYTIPWLYQKVTGNLRFDRDYVEDPNDPPQDIRAVIMEVTTLHVKIRLSGSPTHANLIWRWKVVAPEALVDPNPAGSSPSYAIIPAGALNGSSARNLAASRTGAALNSNVFSGGGTNDTAVLNVALADFGATGGGTFIMDGAALVSAPGLKVPSNVAILCPNKSCGVYLASGSNCHMVTNSNFTSVTNPHEPSGGSRQKNIAIIGGTWNGNYSGQTVYVNNNVLNSWVCGMWFNGVDNLSIQGVTIYDARKFCLMITYPHNADVIDYTAEYPVSREDNNDALHVWGPATGQLTVRNLRAVNTCDDVLALNYCESRAGMGTGEVDFTGRDAAVSTLIDGVYIENGHSVLRIDGTVASVGVITVRNVVANFSENVALSLLAYGTWKRLLCEDWVLKVPLAAVAGIPKGVQIFSPQNGSVTEIRKWRHTGDGSVHLTDTQQNTLFTVVTTDVATPAAKIIFADIIVDKPATPRGGVLLYFKGSASARVVDEVVVRNSTLLKDGYGYLVQNDLPAVTMGSLSLPGNMLNGATALLGARPPDGLQKPRARVFNSAAISVPNATLSILTFNSERWDSDTIHSTSSNTSRLTCRTAGNYVITANIAYDINATGYRVTRLLLNGTTEIARDVRPALSASDYTVSFTTTIYDLAVSDYVEVQVYQTSGGALNVQPITNSSPEFSMVWLGP